MINTTGLKFYLWSLVTPTHSYEMLNKKINEILDTHVTLQNIKKRNYASKQSHGVVVSMFDFHCSDQGSNPGCDSKISCLRLHYIVVPLASV